MKQITRLLCYAAVLTIWLLSGIIYGFTGIWGIGIFFVALFLGYETILYFKMRKQ